MSKNPFEAQLRAESLGPIDSSPDASGSVRVNREKGAHAGGSKHVEPEPGALEFTAEMAAAMHDIVDHPALEPRHREILRAYLEQDLNWDRVAKKCRCSMSKISEVIERAKHLMLHPNEEPTAVDVSNEDDDVELNAPVEMALSFDDIEESLAISAKTAHRIIKAVAQTPIIGNGELKANESAVRTLVLLRKSELDYLNRSGRKRAPASSDDLHGLASQNKVSE